MGNKTTTENHVFGEQLFTRQTTHIQLMNRKPNCVYVLGGERERGRERQKERDIDRERERSS